MQFWRYLGRRLLLFVIVVFGVVVVTFLISHVLPGDPARALAGPNAAEADVARIRHQHGFDQPLYIQFITFLAGSLQGNLGYSVRTSRPVLTDILQFLPATLEVTILAIIFGFIFGIVLGAFSGRKRNSVTDHGIRTFSIISLSMPSFWLGLLLILVLAVLFPIFPAGGRIDFNLTPPPTVTGFITIDSIIAGRFDTLVSALQHLALPVLVLGTWAASWISRITRAGILKISEQDHVVMARAKGLTENSVFWRHVVRNGLIAPLTLAGILFGYMIEASIPIDLVFAYPGLGSYAQNSIFYTDYNAIVGVAMVIAIVFALTNLLVDILYTFIDPRMRYG